EGWIWQRYLTTPYPPFRGKATVRRLTAGPRAASARLGQPRAIGPAERLRCAASRGKRARRHAMVRRTWRLMLLAAVALPACGVSVDEGTGGSSSVSTTASASSGSGAGGAGGTGAGGD